MVGADIVEDGKVSQFIKAISDMGDGRGRSIKSESEFVESVVDETGDDGDTNMARLIYSSMSNYVKGGGTTESFINEVIYGVTTLENNAQPLSEELVAYNLAKIVVGDIHAQAVGRLTPEARAAYLKSIEEMSGQ